MKDRDSYYIKNVQVYKIVYLYSAPIRCTGRRGLATEVSINSIINKEYFFVYSELFESGKAGERKVTILKIGNSILKSILLV